MPASDMLERRIALSLTELATSLSALAVSTRQVSDGVEVPVTPAGLPEAFRRLLMQLRQDVTGLGIAFKPPVTVAAAIQQLDKLDEHFGKLSSCVIGVAGGEPWAASRLASEWRNAALNVGSQLERFLRTLHEDSSDDAPPASATTSRDENPYARHVGMVWDAVDRATASLSENETTAMIKWWSGQQNFVKDAWEELKEALAVEEEEEEDEDEDEGDLAGDEDDDEWSALEKEMDAVRAMNDEEKATAELIKPILGLQLLLHGSLQRYINPREGHPQNTYLPLCRASELFVAAYDSVVSSLSPRQDSKAVAAALAKMWTTSQDLIATVRRRAWSTSEALESFLSKWETKANDANEVWAERSMSMKRLQAVL